MRRGLLLFLGAMFVAVVFGALAVACGGNGEEAPPAGEGTAVPEAATPSGAATTVQVSLTEWAVEPDVASVAAGEVTFVVHNDGTVHHELAIIKSDLDPAGLPVAGAKVDEGAAGELIGRTETLSPGKTKTVTFDLVPGNYVLLCNLLGHYDAGMFTGFTVK
jgi:uncharacterized cupredoxin-like copper-binding protein